MVRLGDVRRWNAGALEQVFQEVRQRQAVLTSSGDDFLKIMPIEGWQGAAAENAASEHQSLTSRLDHLAAGVAIVNKTIAQAADAIPGVQHAIGEAEELARKYGYQIGDDGQITDVMTNPGPTDPDPADRARVKQQLVDNISQVLRTAGDIDNDLAGVLKQASTGQFGTGNETTVQAAAADALQQSPGEVLTTPPANGTVSQNAAWWASLSPAGQQILLHDHPDWLGNVDGLPAATRSAANIIRLPGERAQLQRQLDELNKEADAPMIGDGDMQVLADEIKGVEAKLHSLDAIQQTMTQGDRQLLFLDTSKPRVEAAVAVGNVDTAQNVAVFTPGFTTTVDGSLPGYDSNMHNLKVESDRLSALHGGGSTAAVTWIGYQAPQADAGIVDPSQSVASPEAAKAGGENLAKFYNGIGASHEASNSPLHLTALGHSYGSTTTGFALGHDTPVNDAILFGSPGQGADHLNLPPGHLYDEHDTGDNLVPDLHGTLGPSPYYSSDATPNYHQLSTDASTSELGQLNATQGHSGYLDDKSTSLYNMAAITTGHPDLAVNYQPPTSSNPPDVHTIPPGVPPSQPMPPPPTVAAPPGQDPTPPPEP